MTLSRQIRDCNCCEYSLYFFIIDHRGTVARWNVSQIFGICLTFPSGKQLIKKTRKTFPVLPVESVIQVTLTSAVQEEGEEMIAVLFSLFFFKCCNKAFQNLFLKTCRHIVFVTTLHISFPLNSAEWHILNRQNLSKPTVIVDENPSSTFQFFKHLFKCEPTSQMYLIS